MNENPKVEKDSLDGGGSRGSEMDILCMHLEQQFPVPLLVLVMWTVLMCRTVHRAAPLSRSV